MSVRNLAECELPHVMGEITCQFALKVKSPELVQSVLRKISKCVVALHSRVEKNKLIIDPTTNIPVFKLPKFNTLEEGCSYMHKHHHLPYDQALGTVGSNDDTIILNINHMAGDGGYYQYLFNQLKNQDENYFNNLKITEIKDQDSLFKKQIESATDIELPPFVDPSNSRIIPRDLMGQTQNLYTVTTSYHSSINELPVFDKASGKVHGLTDLHWTFLTLSSCAHNDKDFSKQNCSIICDLRRYLTNPDFTNTNHFANLSCRTHATKDTTVGEMMKQFRADFTRRLNSTELFGFLKKKTIPFDIQVPPGIDIELSNVGRFELGGPFTDVWITSHIASSVCPGHLAGIAFSVSGNGRNDLYSLMRFASQTISVREMDSIAKSIHYGMENIPLNTRCGEALDILSDYQKRLEKQFDQPHIIKCQ